MSLKHTVLQYTICTLQLHTTYWQLLQFTKRCQYLPSFFKTILNNLYEDDKFSYLFQSTKPLLLTLSPKGVISYFLLVKAFVTVR